MPDRRKPLSEVTPESEDKGIFKGQIVDLLVELVPMFGKTSRGDIVIKGFIDGQNAIEVVFPGRRKVHVQTLQKHLQSTWSRAVQDARVETMRPVVDSVRVPSRIQGGWRPRFRRDDQGWETREHQFYAAQWTFRDRTGTVVTAGEPAKR
ncbi:MAG: hypothetical protein WBA67_03795 [Jannaschia sp.]